MTLYEFLVKTKVDIRDNNNSLGNHLSAELARNKINIDFEKNIENVTDQELLEIGRILILSENKGTFFWSNELVDKMKEIIQKSTKRCITE